MRTEEIVQLTQAHVLGTYARLPLAIAKGRGSRVWDTDGREYLDFLAGIAVNSVGHCHPKVVAAVTAQAQSLLHCSNLYHTEWQARLAQQLALRSALQRVFFCNSGAEANEGAIKLARRHAKLRAGWQGGPADPDAYPYEILCAENSFHGRTLATLTATGQAKYQEGFEPLAAGFRHVPFNDLKAMDEAWSPKVAAVLLEPVQGEGGIRPADVAYLQGVRRLCDERGALLIFDEVQCGMGRTGRWFAHQHAGVLPDICTMAKALGGGLPIGAILVKEEISHVLSQGTHASTFGGNPLTCAAALAVLEVYEEEKLVERAAETGAFFMDSLRALQATYPEIVDVRGLGLMLGAQLSRAAAPVMQAAQERGLLVGLSGPNVLRFVPPLNITQGEVREAVEILDQALLVTQPVEQYGSQGSAVKAG